MMNPAMSSIGPVGPCSPGIHFGYTSVSGPGVTGIVSVAWIIFRGASVKSTLSPISCAGDTCAVAVPVAANTSKPLATL
jgi:hypothetical protein